MTRNVLGLSCPECNRADKLSIEVTEVVALLEDGFEKASDTEWNDDSFAQCDHCDWSGIVGELEQVTEKVETK